MKTTLQKKKKKITEEYKPVYFIYTHTHRDTKMDKCPHLQNFNVILKKIMF